MVVTEKIIASAGLSDHEKKVARVFFKLPTAGSRTQKWVEALSEKGYNQLLKSSKRKLRKIIKGAGN